VRKPLFQMSVIINTDSENSTDKGFVVIDATPDYFRDNIVFALLFFERLQVYIIRAYFTDPEINLQGNHLINIVEEHLISPHFIKKNSFDPQMIRQSVICRKNFELILLFSNAKLMAMGREFPPVFSKGLI